jgi:hypothetical protein
MDTKQALLHLHRTDPEQEGKQPRTHPSHPSVVKHSDQSKPPTEMRRLSMRRVESFLREEQRNLPSFESVLALARNEVAAKNSTTAPMAAAAMPGECSSSPSSPPTSCLLPFTACTVCFCLQAPRSKPTYMLKRKGGK